MLLSSRSICLTASFCQCSCNILDYLLRSPLPFCHGKRTQIENYFDGSFTRDFIEHSNELKTLCVIALCNRISNVAPVRQHHCAQINIATALFMKAIKQNWISSSLHSIEFYGYYTVCAGFYFRIFAASSLIRFFPCCRPTTCKRLCDMLMLAVKLVHF